MALPRTRRRLGALVVIAVAACSPARADAPGTGAIAGHVTAASGRVCVAALDDSGQELARAATDDAGDFTVTDVPAGAWTVEFLPDLGCHGAVTADAFQFASGRATRATADPVTVVAGTTTAGVDATLAAAASIQGTVRDGEGHPLPGICAVLEDTAGRAVLRDLTNIYGEYRLLQLPAGTFLVHFVADGCVGAPPTYPAVYYPGRPALADAMGLALEPGMVWGAVDARLAGAPAADPAAPGAGAVPPGGQAGTAPGDTAAVESPATGTAGGSAGAATGGAHPGRPLIALLAPANGGYRVDARHRIALRVLCQRGGPRCDGRVALSWVLRGGRHRAAGQAELSVAADGRTHVVRVRLRGSGSRLRAAIYLTGRARPVVTATLPKLRRR